MPTGQTLLITGAFGHLGRRVVELLLEAGETNLIATTRTPEKLADFAKQGVTVRYASFDKPEGLPSAFAGADRLLLISTDTVGEPGIRQRQHRAAIDAAVAAKVKHVIYTSLIEPIDTPVLLAPDHAVTEAALADSPLDYTVLRNNMYADLLPQSLMQAQAFGGKLFSSVGDGRASYVTREDCARAAAAALSSTFAGRRTLDVTGPEALSQADLAAIGTSLLGQTITYIPISRETLIDNLIQAGLPHPVAELLASFDQAVAQGKMSAVSTAVEDLTGRKPIRVADFLAQQLVAQS